MKSPLAALVLLCCLARAALAASGPPLVIDAPASMRGAAAEVRAFARDGLGDIVDLVGLQQPGPPIFVTIAPENSEIARSSPPYFAGWAFENLDTIVLIPARARSYPDNGLEQLLRHEVAHILISRSAGGRPVPRWFHEGVAMLAARGWTLEDRSRMVFQVVSSEQISLADLESEFRRGESGAAEAYAVSGSFIRYVTRRSGTLAIGKILNAVGQGTSFDEAFRAATGQPLATAELRWRQSYLVGRWVPLVTSTFALWMVVTLLALWAMAARRARDARIRRRWEEQEDAFRAVDRDGDDDEVVN